MKKFIKYIGLLLATFLFIPVSHAEKDVHPSLHPVTWQGKKWEYLVEHPRDVQVIHTVRFEELMDTVGQHGWELTDVTSENHFYAFYFKRPLLEHKLHAHRVRLSKIITSRLKKEAALQKRIDAAYAKGVEIAKERKKLHERIMQEKKLEKTEAKEVQTLEQILEKDIVQSKQPTQEKQQELKLEQQIKQTEAQEVKEQAKEAQMEQQYGVLTQEQKSETQLIRELKKEKQLLENE